MKTHDDNKRLQNRVHHLMARPAFPSWPLQVSAAQHRMLEMQRTVGNRAVSGQIQAQLTVGPVGDLYEQQADRVAEHVLSMPASHGQGASTGLQRQEEEIQARLPAATVTRLVQPRGEDEEEVQMIPLQRQADGSFSVSDEFEQRLVSTQGAGHPLPPALRAEFEAKFGSDFSGVRIHTDTEAGALNRAISARAFTRGRDIYMGSGAYAPDTLAGKRLLAHELTHTIQQGASPAHIGHHPAPSVSPDTCGAGIRATSNISAGLIQMKRALIADKTRTRIVATGVDRGKPAQDQLKQVEKGRRGQKYHRMDELEVEDDGHAGHINDQSGQPAWLLIKGKTNEYIRASKIISLGYKPVGKKMEGLSELKSLIGQVESAQQAVKVEAEKHELGQKTEEFVESAADVLEKLNTTKIKDEEKGLIRTEEKNAGMTYAQNAIGTVGGMLGLVLGVKKLFATESNVQDRVEAVFDLLSAGADVGGAYPRLSARCRGAVKNCLPLKPPISSSPFPALLKPFGAVFRQSSMWSASSKW